MSFYTDRKKANGLGSAKTGTEHFIAQRISAFALIPLTILFMIFVAPYIGADMMETKLAFSNFWRSLLAALMAIFVGMHIVQGLQVVFEDYISHKGLRVFMIFKLKAGVTILVIAILWALVRLALA